MSDPLLQPASPTRRSDRSSAAEVRNPQLRLSAAQRLRTLPPKCRQALADLLLDLARDVRQRADQSWLRNKAPMPVYWKAVSVYAGHLHRVLRSAETRRRP